MFINNSELVLNSFYNFIQIFIKIKFIKYDIDPNAVKK